MTELLARGTAAEEFEQWLTENHQLFGSSTGFVSAYNSGLLNSKNTEIFGIAQRMEQAYRNVRIRDNRVDILPKDLVVLDESIRALTEEKSILDFREEILQAVDAAGTDELYLEDARSKKPLYVSEDGSLEHVERFAFPGYSNGYLENVPDRFFEAQAFQVDGAEKTYYLVDVAGLRDYKIGDTVRLVSEELASISGSSTGRYSTDY
jgi:hypothetical protein